jgi:hypothetical protein
MERHRRTYREMDRHRRIHRDGETQNDTEISRHRQTSR